MLKRACLLFVALSCAVFAADLGTAENPLIIDDENDLVLLRNAVNAGSGTFKGVDVSNGATDLHFKLGRDLNLSNVCGKDIGSWTPIGTTEHPFKGNFDGNDKTIDYLFIYEDMPARGDTAIGIYGLFGVLATEFTSTTEIKNLTIGENSSVVSMRDGQVGSVIGNAGFNVIVSNCKNKGYVSGRNVVGGIVGFAGNVALPDGVRIKNCVNEGHVDASLKAGGIVGAVNGFGVHIDSCKNLGSVSAADTAAGIVASIYNGIGTNNAELKNVVNKGYVTSGKISGGILAAAGMGRFSIVNAFNSGHVQASMSAGGIVGQAKSYRVPDILMCVNVGEVFAGTNAGGIVGANRDYNIEVSQSLNLGTINAGANAGGIVGYDNTNSLHASYNMNAGAVGFGFAGGIFGRISADAGDNISANLSIAAPDAYAIYDTVMSHFEEDAMYTFDAAHAYVTDCLISGKTIDALGDSLWVYKEGYYPQIKTLVENPMKEIRDAQLVASTPVRLGRGDVVGNITQNISYMLKDASGNVVDVYSARGNVSFVNDSVAAPYSLGTDTLYVLNENATKKIIVNVTSLNKLGTVGNPLTISSLRDLQNLRQALIDSTEYKGVVMNDAGAHSAFKLTNDLDLSSVCGPTKGNWKPIVKFRGKLNGGNHKISNLYVVDSLEQHETGLFSSIIAEDDTVIVENLTLDNVTVRSTKQSNAAALSPYVRAKVAVIRNVTVKGSIRGEFYTGGIVASGGAEQFYLLNNTVEGSVSTVPRTFVDGMTACMGGIFGCFIAGSELTISGNVNRADISSVVEDAGGITGLIFPNSTIENNVNEGKIVSTSGSFLGGLFGRVLDCERFANNHNKGEIHIEGGNAVTGGLVGIITPKTEENVFENSSNEGLIQVGALSTESYISSYTVGGIFGNCRFHRLKGLVNKGDIQIEKGGLATLYAGGIMGLLNISYDSVSVVVDSVVNLGRVEAVSDSQMHYAYVGGVIGYVEKSPFLTIKNSFNEGRVSLKASAVDQDRLNDSFVGGLVGQINADSLYFVNNHNSGTIDAYSRTLHEGGLVGIMSDINQFQIEKCYNEGDVYAKRDVSLHSSITVGGLFGSGGRLVIKDSYNKGNLYVSNSSLIGKLNGTTYNSEIVGGIVGYLVYSSIAEKLSKIENVVNVGNIDFDIAKSSGVADSYIGGIVGQGNMSVSKDAISIENVANYGSIRAHSASSKLMAAGIMGYSHSSVGMKNVVSGGSLVTDFITTGSRYNNIANVWKDSLCVVHSAIAYGAIIPGVKSLYHSIAWDSAVVDKQYVSMDTLQARYSTSELTADSLPSVLHSEDWVNVKGYYPQLKSLAESPDESMRNISALGATPIYLSSTDSGYVRSDSIAGSFKVATKNALGESAAWSSNVSQLEFNKGTASFKSLSRDTLAMLTVESDGVAKSIWVYLIGDETVPPEKTDLDFSNVVWNYTAPFKYDGKEKSVALKGLPEQVKATYSNGTATVPGTYVARVTLQYDTALYNVPVFKDSLKWVINKDTLDLSKIVWCKTIEFDFDSTEHSVKLENVPEQVMVDYADASQIKAGEYHAMAVLRYDTSLYVANGYKDSILVWKILAGPTKAVASVNAPNRVNLVYRGARTWALEFTQSVPANAKIAVVGVDGKRIVAHVQHHAQSIVLQDMPANGIALVRVTYPGMSKTFKINLR